SPFL
ncbi:CDP-diacylglycerol--serine O-phosphatidyltransferase, partial [Haemophilus influenzae]